jgi:hypothetical protein
VQKWLSKWVRHERHASRQVPSWLIFDVGQKWKTLFVIGLVLLLPSLYTIGLIARELSVGERVYGRLHVDGEYLNLSPSWKGHSISLTDEALPSDSSVRVIQPWGFKERPGRVTLNIDGRDYSWPHEVGIRPESDRILNRYHHWIFMGRLKDTRKRDEEFLIVQRFVDRGEDWYRVLRVPDSGEVYQEVFPHSARTSPIERTFFVRLVYPMGIGFYSDVLQFWPSILYPIAYPAGTGLLGIFLLCGVAFRKFRKSKTPNKAPEPTTMAVTPRAIE